MQRPLIMGVLNATPDSFSDGGHFLDPAVAIRHGQALVAAGAEIIDVGGESTRPGAERVGATEELSRVLPLIRGLAAVLPEVTISIDTMRAETARAAVAAGASIVNDVSGGLADPDMLHCVAELGCDYVCQHWRAPSAVMNDHAEYSDVVSEVRDELRLRVNAALDAGIAPERIIVDPGLGFAKQPEHDWAIVGQLVRFTDLGYRVLFGGSRKRFLALPGDTPAERDTATAAVNLLAAAAGVWAVRVHNPAVTARAFDALELVK